MVKYQLTVFNTLRRKWPELFLQSLTTLRHPYSSNFTINMTLKKRTFLVHLLYGSNEIGIPKG